MSGNQESTETRMWREINESRQKIQGHEYRIDALELRTDGISKAVADNFCTVCKKIDGLKETVLVMETQRKTEEKSASHVFDRYIPLILGAISIAVAAMKLQ